MKALSITTALIAAVFLAGLAITFAAAEEGNGAGSAGKADCPNFVDADSDGINDNCTGDGTRPQDGTGQKRGARRGRGNGGGNPDCPNFTDEDGDGVNDNCTNDGKRPQDGTGLKKRAKHGGRRGSGNSRGMGCRIRRGGRS